MDSKGGAFRKGTAPQFRHHPIKRDLGFSPGASGRNGRGSAMVPPRRERHPWASPPPAETKHDRFSPRQSRLRTECGQLPRWQPTPPHHAARRRTAAHTTKSAGQHSSNGPRLSAAPSTAPGPPPRLPSPHRGSHRQLHHRKRCSTHLHRHHHEQGTERPWQ